MTLREAIDRYVAWRQAMGTRFVSGAAILRLYRRSVGSGIRCDDVTDEQARVFVAGNGPLTRYRANKHTVLAGFYRYAIGRGYAARSPLPENEPKAPPSAPPHIYSHDELRRLFGAVDACRQRAVQLDAPTFRLLLLLLYGAGLRHGEARRLALADVDLPGALLAVRDTKFHKSRLVPVGPRLARALAAYAARRAAYPVPLGKDSAFLANRDGTRLAPRTVHKAFAALRRAAGVRGADGARQQPCLHSFRHSFAVHRLTSWYRQGADVQRLLPFLSTYLGHASLAGTQVYLSMTPELLRQASIRFERYATGGRDD